MHEVIISSFEVQNKSSFLIRLQFSLDINDNGDEYYPDIADQVDCEDELDKNRTNFEDLSDENSLRNIVIVLIHTVSKFIVHQSSLLLITYHSINYEFVILRTYEMRNVP